MTDKQNASDDVERLQLAIDRTRAFKVYYDKGDAVANTYEHDAMILLTAHDQQAAENERLRALLRECFTIIPWRAFGRSHPDMVPLKERIAAALRGEDND